MTLFNAVIIVPNNSPPDRYMSQTPAKKNVDKMFKRVNQRTNVW